mmetsp:Transcript_27973/g.59450  ORF Transcript_27973/g.59450 Transcript_27973/m.59450 type:complete len:194 (-) Transcript_27973:34-615(-)
MFSLLAGFYSWLTEQEERRMVILGIDNAGKTTMLEQLKAAFGLPALAPEKVVPTIGMNIGKIKVDGVQAVLWDLGGQLSLRSLWHNYFAEVEGIMFLIDSQDRARMVEAKEALYGILRHPELAGVPLLVVANKQDMAEAVGVSEISQLFELEGITDRECHIHPCSALKRQGIEESIRWLTTVSVSRPKRSEHR